ncbi:MAG: histidine phosphatase family protein [Clostridia bacterium]|nr:histidine phosphatase family protein [Clostridia bacterium]
MKTYKIHLIRHGLTQENLHGQYIGHKDVPLCEKGIADLQKVKEDYRYPDVPVVFTSPLKRCLQTCEILYPDVRPMVLDGLIEYNFGTFEGQTAADLQEDEDFLQWIGGGLDAEPPFGESGREFGERIGQTFEKIVDSLLQTGIPEAAIITHGGVLNALMAMYALPQAPMTDWMCDEGFGYTGLITPSLWSQGRKFEASAQCPVEIKSFDPLGDTY